MIVSISYVPEKYYLTGSYKYQPAAIMTLEWRTDIRQIIRSGSIRIDVGGGELFPKVAG